MQQWRLQEIGYKGENMLAVIGLGTNQGDREENLKIALHALNLVPNIEVKRFSSIYETLPYGYSDQPNFLNMVAEVQTSLSPEALLGVCLGIEAGMGRVRLFKNGPRILDLDFLVGENVQSDTPELKVPHPEILNRSFVLVPLKELYPSGNAFGFSFQKAFETHAKNDIQVYLTEEKLTKIL